MLLHGNGTTTEKTEVLRGNCIAKVSLSLLRKDQAVLSMATDSWRPDNAIKLQQAALAFLSLLSFGRCLRVLHTSLDQHILSVAMFLPSLELL